MDDLDYMQILKDEFDEIVADAEVKHGYCPTCAIPMQHIDIDYKCQTCGYTCIWEPETTTDISTGHFHICSGGNKGKFYNPITDYSKTQKRTLKDQFIRLADVYHDAYPAATPIPERIIDQAIEIYNGIQKFAIQHQSGAVTLGEKPGDGERKFVRRGTIKDEILASLIYYICQNENRSRRKRDIAIFMKLTGQGFPRGEDIVKILAKQGVITLDMSEKPFTYIERYLAVLQIDEKYIDFITQVVELSDQNNICTRSQTSSKIVGAISILIQILGLKITSKQIEAACDNTKKNTFDKFAKEILSNMKIFAPLFREYGLIE